MLKFSENYTRFCQVFSNMRALVFGLGLILDYFDSSLMTKCNFLINPIHATVLFLYSLEASEKL